MQDLKTKENVTHHIADIFYSPELINAYSSYIWPIVLLIILWFFKSDIFFAINKLIDKVEEVTPNGFKFGPLNSEANKQPITDENIKSTVPLEEALKDLPLYKHYIEIMRPEIDNQIKISGMRETDWLRAKVTELNILYHFQRIFGAMLKSQYKAMIWIEHCQNKSPKKYVKGFYETAAQNNEFAPQSFALFDWLKYMQQYNLILESEDTYSLTEEGKAYLRFVEHNYPAIARDFQIQP